MEPHGLPGVRPKWMGLGFPLTYSGASQGGREAAVPPTLTVSSSLPPEGHELLPREAGRTAGLSVPFVS